MKNKGDIYMLYKVTSSKGILIKYFSDNTCNGVVCRFCDDVLHLWDSCYRVYIYKHKKWFLVIANVCF